MFQIFHSLKNSEHQVFTLRIKPKALFTPKNLGKVSIIQSKKERVKLWNFGFLHLKKFLSANYLRLRKNKKRNNGVD